MRNLYIPAPLETWYPCRHTHTHTPLKIPYPMVSISLSSSCGPVCTGVCVCLCVCIINVISAFFLKVFINICPCKQSCGYRISCRAIGQAKLIITLFLLYNVACWFVMCINIPNEIWHFLLHINLYGLWFHLLTSLKVCVDIGKVVLQYDVIRYARVIWDRDNVGHLSSVE